MQSGKGGVFSMLNKELFKEQIERLLYLNPTWKIESTNPKALKAWYDVFKDLHDVQFTKMVDKYIRTKDVVPTPGGLLSCKEEYNAPLTPEEKEKARKSLEELLGPNSIALGGGHDFE